MDVRCQGPTAIEEKKIPQVIEGEERRSDRRKNGKLQPRPTAWLGKSDDRMIDLAYVLLGWGVMGCYI